MIQLDALLQSGCAVPSRGGASWPRPSVSGYAPNSRMTTLAAPMPASLTSPPPRSPSSIRSKEVLGHAHYKNYASGRMRSF